MRHLVKPRRLATTALAVMVAISAAAVIAAWFGVSFGLGPDPAVVLGTIASVASFALVAATLVVALLTLLDATGAPDLWARVAYPFSSEGDELCLSSHRLEGGSRQVDSFKQANGHIFVSNRSRYPARNVSVHIEFVGCSGIDVPAGWSAVSWVTTVGLTEMQWDGGGDYIVHGNWSRQLPAVDLTGLRQFSPNPALIITLVAEAATASSQRIPVHFLTSEQWSQRNAAWPPGPL